MISGDFKNPGEARNAGIAITEGQWVVFWDADDQPKIDAYISSVREKSQCSLVVGNFEIIDFNGKKIKSFDSKDALRKVGINPGIWRFIFRRELLEGIEFPAISLGEDQVFLAHIFSKHPSWGYVEDVFYSYRVGVEGQLTSAIRVNRVKDQFEAIVTISEISSPCGSACFFCESILAMKWKLSLGCLRNLGLLGSIEGVSFWKSRFFLARGIFDLGLKRNMKFLWSLW